jgi:cell wall-associated NlpC family hydrolase
MPASAQTRAATAAGAGCGAALLLAAAAASAVLAFALAAGGPPSPRGLADIPPAMLALYQRAAATCPGLPWTVLAGIGKAESDHGRAPVQVSPAGAVGPMQFEPATFAAYDQPTPPGGADPPTPWDRADAVYAAARLLCANGARGGADIPRAVYAYNHSRAYVTEVLSYARAYTAAAQAAVVPPAGPAAARALAFARTQLGVPYQWGAEAPGRAFDCSGLTQAAYAAAGIALPRTAQAQYDHGPQLKPGAPIAPGDLLFFGTGPGTVVHVGIAVDATDMIDAPHPGALVRQEPVTGHLVGVTRPG